LEKKSGILGVLDVHKKMAIFFPYIPVPFWEVLHPRTEILIEKYILFNFFLLFLCPCN